MARRGPGFNHPAVLPENPSNLGDLRHLLWAECGLRAALLAVTWIFARRVSPREYLAVITLSSMLAGGLWWLGLGHLACKPWPDFGWLTGLDEMLGWAGLALCCRLVARRIWFVPNAAAQPGFRILGTAAALAGTLGLVRAGMPWVREDWGTGLIVLSVLGFLAMQLVLQIALTPWLLDKRRVMPAADARPLWLLCGYLVLEMGLVISWRPVFHIAIS